MRTIPVEKVVTYFDNYLNKNNDVLEIEKDNKTTYFYTDKKLENTHCGTIAIIKYRDWNKANVSISYVSDQEYKALKKRDLEYRYNQVLQNGKLSTLDLQFIKLWGCYRDYENGNVGLEDELDIAENVIGLGIDKDKYYINGMDDLFKKSVNAMYNGDDDFDLFPEDIYEYYFDIDEWGMPNGMGKITSQELEDYSKLECAAEDYLGSHVYRLKYIYGRCLDDIRNKNTPLHLINCLYFYRDLNGSDIYDFIDYEKHKTPYDLADAILHDFYFNVRHKCLEALIKNKDDEGFMENYRKLSVGDFRMNDDMELEIIENKEFYKMCGVEVDKENEIEVELEEDLGR